MKIFKKFFSIFIQKNEKKAEPISFEEFRGTWLNKEVTRIYSQMPIGVFPDTGVLYAQANTAFELIFPDSSRDELDKKLASGEMRIYLKNFYKNR